MENMLLDSHAVIGQKCYVDVFEHFVTNML